MEQLLAFVKKHILIILLISIIFTFLAPLLFTLKLNLIDFTETGQIGDTIGGITAPFINILNAILIYIAFTEQLNANNLLKDQIAEEKDKEKQRLENIKRLITFDIENNIIPSLESLKEEIIIYLKNKETGILSTYSTFPELNDGIYTNINHSDLLKIYDIDFKCITQIYLYVNYLNKITPLNISHKYPTDRNSLILINLDDDKYEALKERHVEKIILELTNAKDRTIDACLRNCRRIVPSTDLFSEMELRYY